MKKEKAKHPIYQLKSRWQESTHSVWIGSTLTLYRNFGKYKFPGALDHSRKEQIISLVYEILKSCPSLKEPALFLSQQLGPLEKEFLFEHFLATTNFYEAHGGEGFITDQEGDFLAVVNLGDHLQLELTDTEQEIEKTWERLVKIEQHICKSVDFAYNPRFGFLTHNPEYAGTGLIIRLFLHIPAIIHTGELPEILEKELEEEVVATGIQGSSSEMIGDLILAQNSCTIGLTEEYLLTTLRMWATKVIVAEVAIRKKLKNNGDVQLKNKVARALGLLTHSYQLETVEALNALSLVKLGLELGWIKGDQPLNFYQIVLDCRRAHLINKLGGGVEIPQLPRKRAEYLSTLFMPLTLKI